MSKYKIDAQSLDEDFHYPSSKKVGCLRVKSLQIDQSLHYLIQGMYKDFDREDEADSSLLD